MQFELRTLLLKERCSKKSPSSLLSSKSNCLSSRVKFSRAFFRKMKFFRWAADRIKTNGVVCFVSNNSFVDQFAFDGMRKHLLQDFTRIYHLHLEGNVRHNPALSGTAYNVFGIQVAVGITIAIRCDSRANASNRRENCLELVRGRCCRTRPCDADS